MAKNTNDTIERGSDISPVDELISSFESTQSSTKDGIADILSGNASLDEVPLEGTKREMSQDEKDDLEDLLMRM